MAPVGWKTPKQASARVYHYSKQLCDGEVVKIEKKTKLGREAELETWRCWWVRERAEVYMLSLPSGNSGMVYSSLKFMQRTDSAPNPQLSGGIPQALYNNWEPRWGKLHFLNWTSSKDHCGLQYHRRPFRCRWSVLLPQTVMKPGIHVDICNLCCWSKPRWCPQALPFLGAMLMWVACVNHLSPCWGLRSVQPLRAISESGILILPRALLMSVTLVFLDKVAVVLKVSALIIFCRNTAYFWKENKEELTK